MKKIFVTKPFFPKGEGYQNYLKIDLESQILTNNGYLHQQFEKQLTKKLEIHNISLINNGTIALE